MPHFRHSMSAVAKPLCVAPYCTVLYVCFFYFQAMPWWGSSCEDVVLQSIWCCRVRRCTCYFQARAMQLSCNGSARTVIAAVDVEHVRHIPHTFKSRSNYKSISAGYPALRASLYENATRSSSVYMYACSYVFSRNAINYVRPHTSICMYWLLRTLIMYI